MSKCAGLAQEIGFFCTKFVQLAMDGKRRNILGAQYFSLVDHNDWSRWFAISSPHIYAVPVTVLLVGLPKKNS
jgi:hypothetical protein